jgi:hypothetical protein
VEDGAQGNYLSSDTHILTNLKPLGVKTEALHVELVAPASANSTADYFEGKRRPALKKLLLGKKSSCAKLF